jgi:NAD(P)-dependent dehydrogenase (short-subunit alcohol dehydrogenase family)
MTKTWLITGASRGLGRAIAEAALAAGDNVVATARDPGRLADLEARYPDTLLCFALDVTDMAAAQVAVTVTLDTFGRLDVLVNNAGYGHAAAFEQTSEESFRAQIETNFYGVVNLTRAALPVLRSQRSGHIINISSVAAARLRPGSAPINRRNGRSAASAR